MKVALVIERTDPSRGGRETSTAQIAAHLARRGHAVTVLCGRGDWRCDGVEVRGLGRRGLSRLGRMQNFLFAAAAAISRERFDIVHSMLPVPGANVYQPRGGSVPGQVEASRRRWGLLGWPRVAVFERLNRVRNLLGRLERQVVTDPRVSCLAVSRMVAQEFSDYFGAESNVRVIYNAVDVPEVDAEQRADWRQKIRFQLGVGQGDPVFLTVATNFPLKGVTETIRAFARWYHSNQGAINGRLVVVGRDAVEGYERIAGLQDVGGVVAFVPPADDVFRWYAAADACVLLSWYDPCSRVVLEATRWAIPSITTVYNGAAEVLAEGAGIVVDSPKNVRAVAAAMDELADPKARAKRSDACLRLADRLRMERHVDELIREYERIAARGTA